MTKLPLLGMLMLSFASIGCGTVANVAMLKVPYGGTMIDYGVVEATVKEGTARISGQPYQHDELYAPPIAPFALIDLPFSIVADTLTLPYTILANRHQLAREKLEKTEPEYHEVTPVGATTESSLLPSPLPPNK